ncbi:MAG: FkbM family methyltransferase [Thermoanaerobaculia bacterium]
MSPGAARVCRRLNHSALFSREVSLGNRKFRAPSADRLLALWLLRLGLLGQDEIRALRRLVLPGQTAVDVGANQGVFTVLLADLVGPGGTVLAFEPEPLLFQSLSENCRTNGIRNVELHNSALSDRRGRAVLHLPAVHSGDNRLDVPAGRGPGVEVDVETLDEVLAARPVDLVKIDVQGHEPRVFAGMERTLRQRPAPVLIFEFWPDGLRQAGEDPGKALANFREIGYGLSSIRRDGSLANLDEDRVAGLRGHFGFVNIVARHSAG